jgi:hypothetical protein
MASRVKIEKKAVIRKAKKSRNSSMMGCTMWLVAGKKVYQVRGSSSTDYEGFLDSLNFL